MSDRRIPVIERSFSIHLGALAPTLTQQFADAGVRMNPTLLAHWQKDQDAIARLAVRGLLSDTEARKARERLCKKIRAESK
jgi:hypothetical protein